MCLYKKTVGGHHFFCNGSGQKSVSFDKFSCSSFYLLLELGHKSSDANIYVNNGIDIKSFKCKEIRVAFQ